VCCADSDCSDGIGCTKDSCNSGLCSHQADDAVCLSAAPICDPKLGCIACNSAADCNDDIACTLDSCVNNKCVNAKQCNANCCCTDADCQGGITTLALPIGQKCTYNVCGAGGVCAPKTTVCSVGGCCKYGCCGIVPL
jgi:hypothetical protein